MLAFAPFPSHSRPLLLRLAAGLLLLLIGTGTAWADLVTGLQGYWSFNGNALDSSGNGVNLTLFGTPTPPGFGGNFFGNQALSLNGNGTQIAKDTSNNPVFNFGAGDFTVQIWVNYNSFSHEQTLIEKFDGASGPGWTFTSDPGGSGGFLFFGNGMGSVSGTPGGGVSLGAWHQLIARRSGTTLDLFFDDNLLNGVTLGGAITSATNPLLIGNRDAPSGQNFPVDGSLADAAIWDRALSDAEISTLFTNLGAVPEPGSLILLGSVAVGAMGYGWRKRQQAKRSPAA